MSARQDASRLAPGGALLERVQAALSPAACRLGNVRKLVGRENGLLWLRV